MAEDLRTQYDAGHVRVMSEGGHVIRVHRTHVVVSALLVLLVSQPLAQTPSLSSTSPTANDPTFTPEAFSSYVRFLADDLLEGRMTGTRGYDLAAAYVATRFEALGLKPAVDNGWF